MDKQIKEKSSRKSHARRKLSIEGKVNGENKSIVIASLLMVPQLTLDDVAVRASCRREDVERVKKLQTEELTPALRAHYRYMIEARAPADKRAEVILGIMNQYKKFPRAALDAIEYVDKVVGTNPIERKDQPAPTGLFELPAGTKVQVAMTTPPTFNLSTITETDPAEGDSQAISVPTDHPTEVFQGEKEVFQPHPQLAGHKESSEPQ